MEQVLDGEWQQVVSDWLRERGLIEAGYGERLIMSSGEVFLSIGRAYSATEAAALLSMDVRTFNRRVDEGMIAPLWPMGDRRFSGYMIARLLGWPLSDDARDYLPSEAGGLPIFEIDDKIEWTERMS